MRFLLSLYHPRTPFFLVYMLQQVEYRPRPFVVWVKHSAVANTSLNRVMHRQTLDRTQKATLLLAELYGTALVWVALGLWLIWSALIHPVAIALAAAMLYPLVLLSVAAITVKLAYVFVVRPAERRMMAETTSIMQKHPGMTIAVAGSYGKTTMKELLLAVLGAKLRVAATEGNRNTPAAHAEFARSLSGQEDVVIFELGEGAPGDVEDFAATLRPDIAIITGLAPNHLDQYGTIDELARDFMTLRRSVPSEHLYFAADSALLGTYLTDKDQTYGLEGGRSWHVSDVHISAEHTMFTLMHNSQKLTIESKLLGRHQIAPLALAAVIALGMGLNAVEVETANAAVTPYEHRMSSYFINGATVIDDTYNGNLEGIMAGLSFLQEIEAKRKVYVTPGLVDQGGETATVHCQIAAKIAEIAPDLLVLMQNSATAIIADELAKLHYSGAVQVQDDPLSFYQGLEHIVRAGDVVLMQNDWTDNYH